MINIKKNSGLIKCCLNILDFEHNRHQFQHLYIGMLINIEPDPLDIRCSSDADQFFDYQILLSKFTSMVSDSRISDQYLSLIHI